jgi:hypothetical protein
MGDYGDANRTATTSTSSDTVAPQRKPLPKGSDGSKPIARQPGEKPKPKKSGVMFEAHNVRDLAEPAEKSSRLASAFVFDPPALEFQGTSSQEVRIHNYSGESQTIDAWEVVGDVASFETTFVGARSVPIAPGGSIVFDVRFNSDAAMPQAAALIVRSVLSDRAARLDLVGMQSLALEEVENQADHGVPISATTPDGRPNSITSAMNSVGAAWTAIAFSQHEAIGDLKIKASSPKAKSWKDELLNDAIGVGLSHLIGTVGLFLGGGVALAAWKIVEERMHLGREAAAAAAKKVASVTLTVHEQLVGELAQGALTKAAGSVRDTLEHADPNDREQLRDVFFDAQATTLAAAYADSVTSLNNHEGDYVALESEHPGLGFAALEAYRGNLRDRLRSVTPLQRNAILGMWMSFLARVELGTHEPAEGGAEKAGSALDLNLYKPTDDHHRISHLANGVLELHVTWDYDHMVDGPIFELNHARVVGVEDKLKAILTQAPLGQFPVPLLVYGKVRRELGTGAVAGSHLGIGRNEGGTLWLGAQPNTDGAGMLELLGDGDVYAGARRLLQHIDLMTLAKVD